MRHKICEGSPSGQECTQSFLIYLLSLIIDMSLVSLFFILLLWSLVCLLSLISPETLKVVKIVQTFNFFLVLKYFWKLGEREGV